MSSRFYAALCGMSAMSCVICVLTGLWFRAVWNAVSCVWMWRLAK